jgi:replicative DNA helicase
LTSNAPSSTNSEYYSRILYEKYLLRSLIDKTRGITESAFESNADIYQFLESTYSQIGEAIRVRPGEDFDIDNLLEDTIINLSDNDNTICTGFRDIDELTGGMTRGEITIIGGRPSHGKTTLAMNIVSNIINGRKHKVCFINREMTNIEMMNKLMVLESGNVSYKMLRKRALTKKDFEEIERTKETIKEKYNSDKFVMFDNIRDFATSSSQIKKFCPDVIVDDYVQLIQPVTETKDRRLQIEEIVNSYKWIAKELNCVVILVSQLNRSIETRVNPKPRMSDLAESGSLEQAAENILFVYYDYKVHYEESEKGKDVIEVIASKVRYGESGSVDMKYNGDKCSFESEELIPY